jgi:hypothetical protein
VTLCATFVRVGDRTRTIGIGEGVLQRGVMTVLPESRRDAVATAAAAGTAAEVLLRDRAATVVTDGPRPSHVCGKGANSPGEIALILLVVRVGPAAVAPAAAAEGCTATNIAAGVTPAFTTGPALALP